ncbi:NAD-dependent epimerase/dehydratase family protein [Arthrobacter sp. H14-L1]|uniref:NAD-dependent epimerase/dehydratase family protein n=1 Tax=Arthrobacter sp. H14-L1 TaxID=2996697 RepID=UPI002271A230|nr:NAD-dependent epimerase/dehydratase family protein [Arthrobacter sp. H14-L1]MCY0906120.1 NAD-dependent epimerase/dehydratase family protein [Arthrobacter sp. H14-L1]
MRIAVIGATGNAGTALLRRLHGADGVDAILGIARHLPDPDTEPYAGVQWHPVDISSAMAAPQLSAILNGTDVVVNLAWAIQPNHDEAAMFATNVTGLENVLLAAVSAGVQHIVYASSVGAYSPGTKIRRTDETWPTGGIHTSHYSRHKAAAERLLDAFEAEQPNLVVSRLRPSLIFQRGAGSEVGRLFLGPFVPKYAGYKITTPLLPLPRELTFQAVHADDVADAYWRVIEQRAAGAFNVAGEPVITPELLGWILGTRRIITLPLAVLRALAAVTWRLRLQRTDPGWIDMAAQSPVMSTDKIRALGWEPRISSVDAMVEVIKGMGYGDGVQGSPKLLPRKKAAST